MSRGSFGRQHTVGVKLVRNVRGAIEPCRGVMRTANTSETERLRAAWEDHKDRLWRSVLAWSGDREIASEAVAEAFAQAARRGAAIDDVGRWVWRSAFRIAGGMLADRRSEHERSESRDEVSVEEPVHDSLPEDVVGLLDALDRLRSEDRTAIVLAYVGGWSAPEIAAMTDSTGGAVRVRLHRARRKLRAALEVRDD